MKSVYRFVLVVLCLAIASMGFEEALAADPFIEYCRGSLSPEAHKTMQVLFKKVGAKADFSQASCEKLQKAFLATTNLGFVSRSGPLESPDEISDITVVKYFPHLTQVILRRNPVKDISALKELPKLELADLSGTQVDDLSVLSGATHLRRLGVSATAVTRIGSLGGDVLKNLTQLQLNGLQLTDWIELQKAISLESMVANETNIESLEPLKHSQKLSVLRLKQSKKLTSLTGLSSLKALKELYISHAQVSVLDVDGLTNLVVLSAEDLPLDQAPNLSQQTKLEKVSLDRTRLQQIPTLSSTVTLVSVFDNPVTSLLPLKSLPNLKQVRVKGTKVSDLSPLSELKQLKEVDIRDTDVSDVSPLNSVKTLEWLYVSGAKISKEEAEKQLADLTKVHENGQGEEVQLFVTQGPDSGSLGIGL